MEHTGRLDSILLTWTILMYIPDCCRLSCSTLYLLLIWNILLYIPDFAGYLATQYICYWPRLACCIALTVWDYSILLDSISVIELENPVVYCFRLFCYTVYLLLTWTTLLYIPQCSRLSCSISLTVSGYPVLYPSLFQATLFYISHCLRLSCSISLTVWGYSVLYPSLF